MVRTLTSSHARKRPSWDLAAALFARQAQCRQVSSDQDCLLIGWFRAEELRPGDRLAAPPQPETDVHPHAPAERAELFTALTGGAVEIETLTLMNALAFQYKPRLILETGTGSGYSAVAIASALEANGLSEVHTVELEGATSARARKNVAALEPALLDRIHFHVGDSLAWIDAWEGEPFDFAFFDSLVAFRHLELERLLEHGLLAPGAVCAFHDASRARGEYYPDMIAALDRHGLRGDRLECGLSPLKGRESSALLAPDSPSSSPA